MWTQAYEAYLEEIANHCEVALDAMGELSFSVMNLRRLSFASKKYHDFHNKVFHSICLFLTHTGVISGMLWPEKCKESDESDFCLHPKNSITNKIKKGLSPAGRSILNNRQLRSDTRLIFEKMGKESDFRNNIVGSCPDFMNTPLAREICAYDSMSRVFYFYGEPFKIDDLTVAVYELLNRIRKETEKRHTASPMFDERPAQANT